VLANKAAFKAIIFNRIGDYCLSLAICLTQVYVGSVEYGVVFSVIRYLAMSDKSFICTLIGILLFIAACGKSAQLGLHF